VRDATQRLGDRRGELGQEVGGRGGGADDRVRPEHRTVRAGHLVALRLRPRGEAVRGGVGDDPDAGDTETLLQGLDQLGKAGPRRQEGRRSRYASRWLRTCALGENRGSDQPAVLKLAAAQLGERRRQAEAAAVARVDAAHQRLDEPRVGLAAEPALDERRQRLVLLRSPRRQQDIEAHPHLAERRDEPRPRDRPETGGDKAGQPLGQPVQPDAAQHEGAARRLVRALQALL
jgi:hypothetical protein